jgi:Phytoene/squalene synthetase
MDINFRQPDRWHDLLYYCHHSANPIGEMVLRLFGEWNSVTEPLSNYITTALQLINFWQDLSIDRQNNRNYIPKEVTEANLFELFDYTEKILNLGIDLPNYLNSKHLKWEVIVIIKAAKLMCKKKKNWGFDY